MKKLVGGVLLLAGVALIGYGAYGLANWPPTPPRDISNPAFLIVIIGAITTACGVCWIEHYE